MIEIDVSRKTYHRDHDQSELVVLRDIRFSVEPGQFCCVVGPSGCGKTSLLNMISGLDEDFSGSVIIDGGAPSAGPPPGYMFQASRLMPWLRVRENVELVTDDPETRVKIDELLGEIGLEDFVDAYPAQLSGGMRRRVALARAIINEPPLLLLDEPFLSLDTPVANRLRRLLIDVCGRRSSTVLFVTHDLREALYLADRVLFISSRPGEIVLDHLVDIQRPRTPEGEDIELLRLDLLKKNPQLLSGLVENGGNGNPGGTNVINHPHPDC
ncbi:MAG: ABC transporter ATP-binding protein [Gammaproteobacteria bacterium]|nr:ABC transporter ATP-binding protein [Gammaproteobacteria bacterium]